MSKTITIEHQETVTTDSPKVSYVLEVLEDVITAEELIKRSVQEHLRKLIREGQFSESKRAKSFSQFYLTQAEIDQMASDGKVTLNPDFGGLDPSSGEFMRKAEESALAAFRVGRLAVLVKGRQLTEFDEELTFEDQTRVVFLRLVPLVGG